MRKRIIGMMLFLSLVSSLPVLGSGVAAQDATPAGEAVDPALCTVEPRTVDELVVIFMEGDYVPDEEIAAGNLPEGEPADDTTIAAVNDTMRQFIACSNAGDFLATLALFTDVGVQFFGPEESDATEEDIRQFFAANPVEPVPEDEQEHFAGLTDVQVLSDGRIGAVYAGTPQDPGAVYVVFLDIEGQYLIDSATEFETGGDPPEATPASQD